MQRNMVNGSESLTLDHIRSPTAETFWLPALVIPQNRSFIEVSVDIG